MLILEESVVDLRAKRLLSLTRKPDRKKGRQSPARKRASIYLVATIPIKLWWLAWCRRPIASQWSHGSDDREGLSRASNQERQEARNGTLQGRWKKRVEAHKQGEATSPSPSRPLSRARAFSRDCLRKQPNWMRRYARVISERELRSDFVPQGFLYVLAQQNGGPPRGPEIAIGWLRNMAVRDLFPPVLPRSRARLLFYGRVNFVFLPPPSSHLIHSWSIFTCHSRGVVAWRTVVNFCLLPTHPSALRNAILRYLSHDSR